MGYTNAMRRRPPRYQRDLGDDFFTDPFNAIFGNSVTIPANGNTDVALLQVAINRLIAAEKSKGITGGPAGAITVDGVMGVNTWTAANQLARAESAAPPDATSAVTAAALVSATGSQSTLAANLANATTLLNLLGDARGAPNPNVNITKGTSGTGIIGLVTQPIQKVSSMFSNITGSTTGMAVAAVAIGILARFVMTERKRSPRGRRR